MIQWDSHGDVYLYIYIYHYNYIYIVHVYIYVYIIILYYIDNVCVNDVICLGSHGFCTQITAIYSKGGIWMIMIGTQVSRRPISSKSIAPSLSVARRFQARLLAI